MICKGLQVTIGLLNFDATSISQRELCPVSLQANVFFLLPRDLYRYRKIPKISPSMYKPLQI